MCVCMDDMNRYERAFMSCTQCNGVKGCFACGIVIVRIICYVLQSLAHNSKCVKQFKWLTAVDPVPVLFNCIRMHIHIVIQFDDSIQEIIKQINCPSEWYSMLVFAHCNHRPFAPKKWCHGKYDHFNGKSINETLQKTNKN